MAISVVMPALEMAQENGKLLAWRKKEGERVIKGEPLLEIETDKAVVEVEAPGDGILAGITAGVGGGVSGGLGEGRGGEEGRVWGGAYYLKKKKKNTTVYIYTILKVTLTLSTFSITMINRLLFTLETHRL